MSYNPKEQPDKILNAADFEALTPDTMKTKQNDNAATHWLQDLANDFESGWIANPSAKAQGLRDRYEKKIKALINEHAALLAVAGAARAFGMLDVSICPNCDGNGLQYPEPCKDACHRCGGTGEIVSDVLPQDVKDIRNTISALRGEGAGQRPAGARYCISSACRNL